MIADILSLYTPSYLRVIVYMLQSTEYQATTYLKWYWRTSNFNKVTRRRSLDTTKAARMLLAALRAGVLLQILLSVLLLVMGLNNSSLTESIIGIILLISYPLVWAHLVVVPLVLGRIFVIKPKERRQIAGSHAIFNQHPAVTIAVAGSYGKTTMKEILLTILSAGKKVAATPANKNVSSSHAQFAHKLAGDEEVLVIEYGEGKPGDVKRFSETTKPNIGVITGLAPAHLDQYKTLRAAGEDIFYLSEFLHDKNVYVNDEPEAIQSFIKPAHIRYDSHAAGDWQIYNIKLGVDRTSFQMKKGDKTFELTSGLLGRHQVGPLAAAALIADSLGLTKQQIEKGVSQIVPFEHRMQPYPLNDGWVIDDTYNGNLEGIRAGLALLKELPAKRKLYVTPGLVDQGEENEAVHLEMGKLIAAANPDAVILMQNSVTKWIKAGLEQASFSGKLQIENEPLRFYENLGHFLAAGDIALLQNDWTDNYN